MLAYCVHRLSSLKARLLSEQFGGNKKNPKGQPYHRATANFLVKDLVAECIDHERRMKVLDRGPPQETEFYCYLGFCSVLLPCYCYYLLPVS